MRLAFMIARCGISHLPYQRRLSVLVICLVLFKAAVADAGELRPRRLPATDAGEPSNPPTLPPNVWPHLAWPHLAWPVAIGPVTPRPHRDVAGPAVSASSSIVPNSQPDPPNSLDHSSLGNQPSFGSLPKTIMVGESASPSATTVPPTADLEMGSSYAPIAESVGPLPITSKFDAYASDFSPTPLPAGSDYHDAAREAWVYDAKSSVPTQSPWIEWGRPFYGTGIPPRGRNWFGSTNLVRPNFYVYGDMRTGILGGRNASGRTDNMASRLNLDLDLWVTDSERFHGFIGPLDRGGQFTRLELKDGRLDYTNVFDPNFVTAFFEGDLGAMWGGFNDVPSPAEMPFTIGLVPLLFQNGIWMEDAVTGAAFALPARHSRLLNWSNYDWTFFAAIDQINSGAFVGDPNAGQFFGSAMFIEAYGGYIECGYAYVRDRNTGSRTYHNLTTSFTRRYFHRISNSVRVIVNTGQDGPRSQRTADGGLFLLENSWITASPLTFVPYANFFYGWGRPQSVARAGGSGGILRNTGLNFDTDGLNGFATLDPTGFDTTGCAIGVDLIGDQLDSQLLLELAYLTQHGNLNPNVHGDQIAVGARYQFPISHSRLLRFDVMHGWRGQLDDVYGTRMEYRWKF
ncbi:MAG: hypothetical protein AAF670_07685 [Planctomycetota bacterium]